MGTPFFTSRKPDPAADVDPHHPDPHEHVDSHSNPVEHANRELSNEYATHVTKRQIDRMSRTLDHGGDLRSGYLARRMAKGLMESAANSAVPGDGLPYRAHRPGAVTEEEFNETVKILEDYRIPKRDVERFREEGERLLRFKKDK